MNVSRAVDIQNTFYFFKLHLSVEKSLSQMWKNQDFRICQWYLIGLCGKSLEKCSESPKPMRTLRLIVLIEKYSIFSFPFKYIINLQFAMSEK